MEYLIDHEWLLGINGFPVRGIYIVKVIGQLGSQYAIFFTRVKTKSLLTNAPRSKTCQSPKRLSRFFAAKRAQMIIIIEDGRYLALLNDQEIPPRNLTITYTLSDCTKKKHRNHCEMVSKTSYSLDRGPKKCSNSLLAYL